jgi:hypothetical protein
MPNTVLKSSARFSLSLRPLRPLALAVLLSASGAASPAHAQVGANSRVWSAAAGQVWNRAAGQVTARSSAPIQVKVERGGRVVLPILNVVRVITDDVDVARAMFEGNQALIEGVTTGSANLRVESADGSVHELVAEVVAPGSLGKLPATPLLPSTPIGGTVELKPNTGRTAPPAVRPGVAPRPVANVAGEEGDDGAPAIVPAPVGVKAESPHEVSVRVQTAEENPSQALVTISYTNVGSEPQDVTLRYELDEWVSYVTNSASGSPRYDNNGTRQLSWPLNGVSQGTTRSVSFRVEALDKTAQTFRSIARAEGADGVVATSKSVAYSFVTTPLLTIFALPDRIIAGRVAPVLVDVRGDEFQAAVDRLQRAGVINGRSSGLFYPNAPTQRAEYAVMTLKGLNLRDLRDVSAIKFVLGRRSVVNVSILNPAGQVVATLVKNEMMTPGERTVLWTGASGSGYVPAGRYKYVCRARDVANGGVVSELSGYINVVAQSPLKPVGAPSFVDVKNGDWYRGYLALAEKQNLVRGYPNGTFRPTKPVTRVEATAIVVRALGLEDLARSQANVDGGFLDYQDIPKWAVGYVNVATMAANAKSAGNKLIVGYPSNFFLPMKSLRRDEAALIVQRLIDKDANRRITVSGAMMPGAVVTINNSTVEAADDGAFSFIIEQDSAAPITVAVTDSRR